MKASKMINEILIKENIKPRELAEILGCHETTISGWRLGKSNPSGDFAIQLRDMYKTMNDGKPVEKKPSTCFEVVGALAQNHNLTYFEAKIIENAILYSKHKKPVFLNEIKKLCADLLALK